MDPDRTTALSRRRLLAAAGTASVIPVAGCNTLGRGRVPPEDVVALTHGVAVGDVTAETAVVWGRLAEGGTLHAEYAADESFEGAARASADVDGGGDPTGTVRLTGLDPGTRYHYRVWGTVADAAADGLPGEDAAIDGGTFRTAPAADAEEGAGVTLAWSGDTYGFGGSPVEPPYPGLRAIADLQPDFFLYLGDTIYADANTPAGQVGGTDDPEDALAVYRAKYREMRDPAEEVADRTNLQELLRATSVCAIWDDHEVLNDFDRTHPLLSTGRRAFLEYWPVDTHESVTGSEAGRLYRSFRWGPHLELFVLDTRQYRDPREVPPEDRTMLGEDQRDWLIESLRSSEATFKVIASSTTMGIVSGDGWSSGGQGYERERDEIVGAIEDEPVPNVLVLSGDIHKAQVAAFDTNGDYVTEFYEASAGPLGAPGGDPHEYVQAFDPQPFYQRGNDFHNFGVIEVEEDGEGLWIEIRHETGKIAFAQRIGAR